ncbi:unnamed protein product [Phyllotreta striolata]|uniref:Malate dehydrogenase n=1 Tax=Phyllotreta striolata TaxID=444603 RepID=A0A9N9TQY1_PHYSR|nr:unnamed protein product [Phyllotreta striolata]
MNPSIPKSKISLHGGGDEEAVLKFLKSAAFLNIVDKAVRQQTDELLAKVDDIREDVRRLTEFNVDVMRLLNSQSAVLKHLHERKDADAKRYGVRTLEHVQEGGFDANFFQKLKLSFDRKRAKSVKMGSDVAEYKEPEKPKFTTSADLTKFVIDCMMKVGTEKEIAKEFADCVISSDARGISTHGVYRLIKYINDIRKRLCLPNALPEIIMETESTAVVDGKNGLGTVIAMFCMNLAIKKAAKGGVSYVTARGSNHFGMAAYYTDYAAKHGYIGMAFSNTSPYMVPFGAKQHFFGTNPIAIAAPGEHDDSFNLDISTTSVSIGKVEMAKIMHLKLALGHAMDVNCCPTTDPNVAIKSKKLAPLGGAGDVGFKGTGLAFMVEILSSMLSGAKYGPNIEHWSDRKGPSNLGHGFIVIDPKKFVPGFEARMSDIMRLYRNLEPIDVNESIMVPGEPEIRKSKLVEKEGLELTDLQWTTINQLVQELRVNPPRWHYKS